MNYSDKTELFVCQCHDVSHQLILSILEDNEDREVYCSYHLETLGFWDRLRNISLFLLGKDRREGDFGCMLINPEDAERLSFFLEYLKDNTTTLSKNYTENQVSYIEDNASKKWQVTPLFTYDIESRENIHNLSIFKRECLSEPSLGIDYDVIHKVSMKNGSIVERFLKSIKYLCGYRSCYGDFDSYTLTRKDVNSLTQFLTILKTI